MRLPLWSLALVLAAPAPAHGQTSAAAELAFRQGRKLMNEGRYQEACPKFEESQRLDPAPGTQLNLADCYEKVGRTASAWETFRAAETAANATGQADFASEARKRAEALESQLCKLAISAAAPEGLEVTLDGKPATALLGSAAPIDPGTHEVAASAPHRKGWRRSVEVRRPGLTVTVEIPALEDTSAPRPNPPPPRPAPEPGRRHRMTPLAWGLAIGSGAVLAVGVGVDAVAYKDLRDCRDQGGCGSQDEVDSIKNRFLVGDILTGVALAAGAGAVVSWWFGGDQPERSVEVVAAPGGAALLMSGHF